MEYGAAAVLDFLAHAGERGMLPTATASALAVACRTVFEILDADEAGDLRRVDLDRVVKQFTNKRARDFNPSSLKEYGRRVRRAWDLFTAWKADPSNFAPKTRTTAAKKGSGRNGRRITESDPSVAPAVAPPRSSPGTVAMTTALQVEGAYASAFPIRRGHVVTIANVPGDLSREEAERLAAFVRMLAAGE